MARTKKRKVGDRIFYEIYQGSICTCLIKDIEERSDTTDIHGKELPEGKLFKYNIFKTGTHSFIEDYNCLKDNDPRVKEFCKGRKFITIDFENNLRQWLLEHGAVEGDDDVAQVLYNLAEEFGDGV